MLDQFSLASALPRNTMCPAADFPARIERDMDLLLSLLGEFADEILLSIFPYLSDPTNTKLQSRTL